MIQWVLLFPGCVTLERDSALQDAQINAPGCFDLSLREDVPIKISVDEHRISLAYEEALIDAEASVAEDTQITNLYINLIGIFEHDGFSPSIVRLTINMWVFNTTEPTRTCYQWRLIDADADGLIDEVAGEIVTEDRKGTVTGIDPLPTPHRDMGEYTLLYRSSLDHFLKILNLRCIDELLKLPVDNNLDSFDL